MVRDVDVERITDEVARLCMEANYYLGDEVIQAFRQALRVEESPTGRQVLEQLIENARIAAEGQVPMCQDTGLVVVFVELGQDVHVVGGDLNEAINAGVARGYTEGYLRKSALKHPLLGGNTGDNTPAIIYVDIVPGDELRITIAPKGGGSENMSRIAMLKPADGVEGIKEFVIDTVDKAGPNPCPPVVVGVGIGGTFDKVAQLAKRAAIREIGSHNPLEDIAQLETALLEEINKLGIGPAGLGGTTTALWVNIEVFPRHIASFPVAVNLQCHAARHKSVVI